MNDPEDEGEDRGEDDDIPNPGEKAPGDGSSISENNFQFKSEASPENQV